MSNFNDKIKDFFGNRKAIVLTFLPLIFVGCGLLIYYDQTKNNKQQEEILEYSEDFEFPENTDTLNAHKTKYDAVLNGEKISKQQDEANRKAMVSDDDFFSAMDQKDEEGNVIIPEEEKVLTLSDLMNKNQKKSVKEEPRPHQNLTKTIEKVIVKEIIVEKEPEDKRRRRSIGENSGNMGHGYSSTERSDDMIYAVIHNGNRKVKNGTHIKLRVTQDSYYNGHFIKNNSYITAVTSPKNERVEIKVTSIKTENGYLETMLYAYDEYDGMKGVYTPASIDNEIADDTKSSALSKGQTTLSIPVIGSISTSALSKKMKENGIPLKDATRLILKPSKK